MSELLRFTVTLALGTPVRTTLKVACPPSLTVSGLVDEVPGVTLIPGAAAGTRAENSLVALPFRLVAVAEIDWPLGTEALKLTTKLLVPAIIAAVPLESLTVMLPLPSVFRSR